MHSYFKKGLILAAFVGIFGAGSGIHAKAAELPVQTGNPAVNADGLLRKIQKTEDQASSIIIEETEKNGVRSGYILPSGRTGTKRSGGGVLLPSGI